MSKARISTPEEPCSSPFYGETPHRAALEKSGATSTTGRCVKMKDNKGRVKDTNQVASWPLTKPNKETDAYALSILNSFKDGLSTEWLPALLKFQWFKLKQRKKRQSKQH